MGLNGVEVFLPFGLVHGGEAAARTCLHCLAVQAQVGCGFSLMNFGVYPGVANRKARPPLPFPFLDFPIGISKSPLAVCELRWPCSSERVLVRVLVFVILRRATLAANVVPGFAMVPLDYESRIALYAIGLLGPSRHDVVADENPTADSDAPY